MKMCENCTVKAAPIWRYNQSLKMLLCNACSIWHRTKHSHRPKPSPEVLARIEAEATTRATKVPGAKRPFQDISPASSSPESDLDPEADRPGKRKRRAREWGEDIEVYADGELLCTLPRPTPALQLTQPGQASERL